MIHPLQNDRMIQICEYNDLYLILILLYLCYPLYPYKFVYPLLSHEAY